MEFEPLLRWLHVIGATVLLGTGAGIAFFMVMARRTGDVHVIAAVLRVVVLADFLFTATAVVAQPVTGYLLVRSVGWSLSEGWLLLSLILYAITGLFWLPVVWIQIRLRNLAEQAAEQGTPLPAQFSTLYHTWFPLGFPAFAAVLAILWLMLNKPAIALP